MLRNLLAILADGNFHSGEELGAHDYEMVKPIN